MQHIDILCFDVFSSINRSRDIDQNIAINEAWRGAQFELSEVGGQDKRSKQMKNNMLRVSCLLLKFPA